MATIKRIIEFLFFRWKREVIKQGNESWGRYTPMEFKAFSYTRDYVDYKYTNKFDGSTKIKRKYLN